MEPLNAHQKEKLRELCEQLDVEFLYLFGSGATNNLKEESDLDFLISFKSNLSVAQYSDNYFDFLEALRNIFDREVDLVTVNSLSNPYFIESVEETKSLIYHEKGQKVSV